ncbi:MAG TPA: M48 family metallopeptidase [Candidatus Paceibacterota bacterium]|nr:M48 family metallopeptidase [Candidatus Paceibacterota bacterium]
MFKAFRLQQVRWVRRRKVVGVPKRLTVQKKAARAQVHARLAHFNAHYAFTYNKVFIRNQRSRWGSCSSKRNLNFSFKLTQLPPELADYIIVHELCHLKEFNHSPRFWALVAETIPDYKTRRSRLYQYPLHLL